MAMGENIVWPMQLITSYVVFSRPGCAASSFVYMMEIDCCMHLAWVIMHDRAQHPHHYSGVQIVEMDAVQMQL